MGRVGAILLVVAAIALPSIGRAQQQRLYKWTDSNGQVHYSETIPPEYADNELLRDRRLGLIESQIKLTEVYLGNLRKRLVDLQVEAINYKPYSTREDAPQVPEDLALDMSRTTASIALYEQTLERLLADQAALKKSFVEDIPRLIEIKGD